MTNTETSAVLPGGYLDLVKAGLAANLPPAAAVQNAPNATQFYYATDTKALYMYDPVANAWVTAGSGTIKDVTATYAIPAVPKQTILLDAVAGFVATLPVATGSGNEVAAIVKTTLTSGAYEISVTAGDSLAGTIVASKSTTPTPYQATLGTTANVTLTEATVGAGVKGDYLLFKDIAANVWEVQGHTWVTGTVATPFS